MSLNLEEYDKVKNYLYLLRAQNEDQKQMGVNFFQAHKNDKEVFECLVKLYGFKPHPKPWECSHIVVHKQELIH